MIYNESQHARNTKGQYAPIGGSPSGTSVTKGALAHVEAKPAPTATVPWTSLRGKARIEARTAAYAASAARYQAELKAIPITIKGETRTVLASLDMDGKTPRAFPRDHIALAKVGRTGSKVWPSRPTVWLRPDGTWTPGSVTHLNRPAYLIGWNNDQVEPQHLSAHNSASGVNQRMIKVNGRMRPIKKG